MFTKMLKCRWKDGARLCIGLDPNEEYIPHGMRIRDSLKEIIEYTHDLALAYKPNRSYFRGPQGAEELFCITQYLLKYAPHMPVIGDIKCMEVGHSAEHIAHDMFEVYGFHAITVSPLFGTTSLEPFLRYADRGVIVLCRESGDNQSSSGEYTECMVELTPKECARWHLCEGERVRLYQKIAYQVRYDWNSNGNCLVMVGADATSALMLVRNIIGDIWMLNPGFGAQGADPLEALRAGLNSRKQGMILSSSRGILYAGDAARIGNFGRRARLQLIEATGRINEALERL